MKNILRRGLALLIIAMIIVSALSISSFAAVSQPAANTGIRDQVCTTFNGTTAPAYYTGSYTYEKLSALSSSSLKSTLTTLMTSTQDGISSYDNCRDYAPYTDCEGGDSSHFTMLYTSYSATYSQYNSGQGWNREHVWPQSLGGGNTSGGGADLHHIRPDEARTNSTRSNRLYGNVSNGTAVTGNLSGEIGGYYGGDNLYEPLDNVKGDVARICLYVYVRWGSSWGASDITSVFESVDTLLEWCALDPVDTWEMERNDVVEAVQGNRNVFIDYPEFAWMIFGESVPTDLVSPSDGVENGTVSGGGSTGGNQGGTTDPETPVDPDPETPTGSATISFDTNDNRTSISTSAQVWQQNGITFTNNKASSTNNVADFIDPVRIYKSSQVIIESPNMTKLVINCDSSYVSGTASGLESAGYTVSTDGSVVTVVLDSPADSVTYVAAAQTRINSIDVYYAEDTGTEDPETPVDPEEPTDPETPVDPETGEVTFEFGENGEASHSDGSGATSYTETNGNYTLTFDSCSGVYKNARDAAGNSALKLGTGSVTASFSFTVPDDVKSVILKIAGYKETAAHITVNGESYTITTMSNSGEYTEITVDTSTEKTVSFATVSTGKRAMLNSITYVIESSTGEGGTTDPDTPVTPEPEEPVEPQPNPGEDIGDGSESGGAVVAGSVTITFDDTSKRTSFSTTEQVWEENGIVFTNTKTSSSSNVADYSNPVRVYAKSNFSVAYKGMTKMVVTCSSSTYASTLATTMTNAGYSPITSGSTVTVEFGTAIDIITLTPSAKVFISSIEVFYEGTEAGCTHDKNENGYCKTCDAGFRTASLVLSTDLAMRYGVEIANAELLALGTPKMIYTFDGKTYEVVEYVITDGYYVFVFEGIAPDEMTMEIVADFYIGDELIVTFTGYSVEKNLLSIRAKNSTDETLVQLINDVLVYGRAAQEFTGKNSSDITGADASDVNASTATPSDETLIEGNENSSLYIKSVGVHFDCVNYVYVKIHVSDPAVFGSLTVDDKSYTLSDMVSLGSGNYRLNLDPVQPTSFSELMLITLTGADSVDYTTVIYSIDCYAGYMCGGGAEVGSAMYNLALALYRYGKSAVAYSVAHSA